MDIITQIVVDTDSPEIKAGIKRHFPSIVVISRPPHLCNDPPMNEILLHDTSVVDADLYIQTHSTNPFLSPSSIAASIDKFLDVTPAYDSLFSVTKIQKRLYDQLGRAVNHKPEILLRTQDLPPLYEENSCIYIFKKEHLIEMRSRIGEAQRVLRRQAEKAVFCS